MTGEVRPIPEGQHGVSAYICVEGAAAAIDFYKTAFAATEPGARILMPGGTIGHAEIRIGDSTLMLADANPEMGFHSPGSLGGSPVMLVHYVEDVDAVMERAVAAGATVLRPVADQFYGDRSGQIEDPFGYRWTVSTHIEDVSEEELQRRAAELYGES